MTSPVREFFLGYRSKRRTPRPEWLEEPSVSEICSACDCMAEGPEGWIDTWAFNRASCFDSVASAMALVPDAERTSFDPYAFWLLSITLDGEGRRVEIDPERVLDSRLPALPLGAGPAWPELGFDVVSLGPTELGFGHSPLSCNGMAEEIAVNALCLLPTLEEALVVAGQFNSEESHVEPGHYYVVRVARQPSG